MDSKEQAFAHLSSRLGYSLPPALTLLWELADERDNCIELRGTWLREIYLEANQELADNRNVYLENNPDCAAGFTRMFSEIDFLGVFNDRGDQFGLWRYAKGLAADQLPVIGLDIDCQFFVGGLSIQDFLAVGSHDLLHRNDLSWDDEDRQDFHRVERWFGDRGIATLPSLEAIKKSISRLPDPQQRFEQYCKKYRT